MYTNNSFSNFKRKKKGGEFFYGVAYYPEGWPFIISGYGHPPKITDSEWLTDLENIKKAGFNVIRVCEFSWPIIEPEPDVYDFELYDKVLDKCADLGIYVILGVDTLNPPEWFFEMYPDAWLINNMGQRTIREWPSPCFSHPGFRERSAKYIKNFISHYKDHPTIVAYQVDNEPAHHPRRRKIIGREELYCYCTYCVNRFKKWLRDKYGDDAPYVPDPLPEFEFFPAWLWVEWRLFNEETIVNKIKWIKEQIKKWDRNHPVTTNIMMHVAFSNEYSAMAHDVWSLAEVLDEVGMDYYSSLTDEKELNYSIRDSAAYSLARSLAKGEKFYCLEIQPTTLRGQGWWSDEKGLREVGDPRLVRLWTWRPVAYGAKSVVYWVWKTQIPTVWALVRPDGSFSKYLNIVREVSDKIKRLSPLIAESKPYPSDVAILYSKRTLHLAFRDKMSEIPIQSILGVFEALWENRIQVDFINVDRAEKGYLMRYKICFAPFLYVVEKALANSLENFVKNGGYLFTDAFYGYFDEKIRYSIVPCNNLDKLMLYRNHLTLLEDKPKFVITKKWGSLKLGATFSGYSYIEEIEALPDAKIIAEFENKLPAVVLAEIGKGKAIHVGTDIARAYFLNKENNAAEMIINLAEMAGAKPLVRVLNLKPEESKNLEITLLRNEKSQIMFLLNANENEVYPKIYVKNAPKNSRIIDALTKQEIASLKYADGFETSVQAYDVRILIIKPKN